MIQERENGKNIEKREDRVRKGEPTNGTVLRVPQGRGQMVRKPENQKLKG